MNNTKTLARTVLELFVVFSLFGFIAGGLVPLQAGCKGLTPEVKSEIVNGEKVACGLANAFMSDPEITALCNFANQETAPILNLVALHRAALAQSKAVGVTEGASLAGACNPAAGGASPTTRQDGGVNPEASPTSKDAGTDAKGAQGKTPAKPG